MFVIGPLRFIRNLGLILCKDEAVRLIDARGIQCLCGGQEYTGVTANGKPEALHTDQEPGGRSEPLDDFDRIWRRIPQFLPGPHLGIAHTRARRRAIEWEAVHVATARGNINIEYQVLVDRVADIVFRDPLAVDDGTGARVRLETGLIDVDGLVDEIEATLLVHEAHGAQTIGLVRDVIAFADIMNAGAYQ